MAKDFVEVKIDIDRMKNGKRVGRGLRAGHDDGIPWFLFVNPSQSLLREKPTAEGAEVPVGGLGYADEPEKLPALQRRKAAVLATADGPEGNVGCPIGLPQFSASLTG